MPSQAEILWASCYEIETVICSGSSVPRARANEVLEAGDHGRGHMVRPQRGALPLTGTAI